jgi:opacity protein-like surface antigen
LAGASFGGDVVEPPKKLFGVSGGYWGDAPVGFEVEYATLPNFFPEPHPDAEHHVTGDLSTLSFNGILGASVGGSREAGFRTYLTGGVVLFDIRADEPEALFDVRGTEVGWNVGGGVIAFINEHVGVRGDVRYVRDPRDAISVQSSHGLGSQASVGFREFSYWRWALGLTLRI